MFESGRDHALSRETLSALAEVLHIEILPEPSHEPAGQVLKYCPIADCPSNIPFVVGGQLCFKPSPVQEPAAARGHCPYCGELFESACPNPDCNAPVCAGACCWHCGEAYVAPATHPSLPLEDWVRDRRKQIREIHQLSTTTIREPLATNSMVNLGTCTEAKPKRNRSAR
jgi:hypothetical protein